MNFDGMIAWHKLHIMCVCVCVCVCCVVLCCVCACACARVCVFKSIHP